jgi:hypothetical protein
MMCNICTRDTSRPQNLLIGTIIQVIHLHVQLHRVVDMVVDTFLVLWYKGEVVKRVELCNLLGLGILFALIVDEPPRDIRVQAIRYNIKQILKIVSSNSMRSNLLSAVKLAQTRAYTRFVAHGR